MISREEVIAAYRLLLGREPESEAVHAQWGEALVWPDLRRNYGEDRMIALAPIGDRLHCDMRRCATRRRCSPIRTEKDDRVKRHGFATFERHE